MEETKRGRKPIPDGKKKQTIRFFLEKEIVDSVGYDELREIAERAGTAAYNQKKAKKK